MRFNIQQTSNKDIVGKGEDEIGMFTWSGSIQGNEAHFIKTYTVQGYSVNYVG